MLPRLWKRSTRRPYVSPRNRLRAELLESRLAPAIFLQENWDGATAPALPAGWTATLTGTTTGWVTTTAFSTSPANSATAPDIATVTDAFLESPTFTPTGIGAFVQFQNRYNLEATFDGMVLEIKIGAAGTYRDIISAGGAFVSTPYDGPISTLFQSPIAGRDAWNGDSGGFQSTKITLPTAAAGQVCQLRWRVATDNSVVAPGTAGAWIDDVIVQTPPTGDLSITKTDGATSVIAGTQTTYTIVVRNAGPDPIIGARVTDTFAAAIASANWTVAYTGGATGPANGTGNIGATLNLPLNGQAMFTVICAIGLTATGNLANTAAVAVPATSVDPSSANNSATDTDTILPPQSELSIDSIGDGVASIPAGAPTTYTIVVRNTGPVAAPNSSITVSAVPGSSIAFTGFTATTTGGATAPASGTGGIANLAIDLPIGSSITFVLASAVDFNATGTLAVTATVSVPTGFTDPQPANNSATDTDDVTAPNGDLGVTTVSNGTGSVVRATTTNYTIVVGNTGPSLILGALVNNTFNPGASVASSSWTRMSTTGGATAPASAGGNLVDVPVNMPPGSSITFRLSAIFDGAATGTIVNAVTIAAPAVAIDPAPANNTLSDTDTFVVPGGDLLVSAISATSFVEPGNDVALSFTVRNTGPDDAPGARIQDAFGALLLNPTWTVTTTGGATAPAGGAGDIDLLADLPAGSSITFTIAGGTAVGVSGTLTNTPTVTAPAGYTDVEPANDSRSTVTQVTLFGDLSIQIADGLTFATAGRPIFYAVVVRNTGPSIATGADVVVDFGILTNVTWTSTVSGNASATPAGTGNINDSVTIGAGAVITYSISAFIPPSATGQLVATADVFEPADFVDTNINNNSVADVDGIVSISGPIFATGAGVGGGPHVEVFDVLTGRLKFSLMAYDSNFRGGVQVAVGDVNGDGQEDFVTAPGYGGGPHIKVFDGYYGTLIATFFAYDAEFRGGVNIAVADVDHDGFGDIITGPGLGGGPHVEVFSGRTFQPIHSFLAFDVRPIGSTQYAGDSGYYSGATVAGGDVNGDGNADIIVGNGPGIVSHVKAFDGVSLAVLADFVPFDTNFLGGVFVAAGEFTGDGLADVAVSPGFGGGPIVRVFDLTTGNIVIDFDAYDPSFRGGVHIAVRDLDGDGQDDILTGAGKSGGPHVKAFSGIDQFELKSFYAYDPAFTGGVFVG